MSGKSLLIKFIPIIIIFSSFPFCSRYKMATLLRTNNLKTYDGAHLPKNEVGYLKCSIRELEIIQLDGKSIKTIKTETGYSGEFSYIELIPGEHVVEVAGSTFTTKHRRMHTNLTVDIASWTVSMRGESSLNFIVEPGHFYLIDMEIKKKKNTEKEKPKGTEYAVTLFIKDVTSKQIVCEIVNDIHK